LRRTGSSRRGDPASAFNQVGTVMTSGNPQQVQFGILRRSALAAQPTLAAQVASVAIFWIDAILSDV